MQTTSRKRKIEQASGYDGDDDDWGNEITAEEFDFIHSQIVDTAAPVVSTSFVLTQTNLNKELEDDLVERGEIHMLRQKLEQKSKELEKERRESVLQLQQTLQLHQNEQAKLISKIDNLESSLKFKEHELRTEQLKVKKFETKPNQPWQTKTSPTKPSLQFPSRFMSDCNKSHISIQTDSMIKSDIRRNGQLQSNHAYSDTKFYSPNFYNKSNSNLVTKSSSKYQFLVNSLNSNEVHKVHQTYIAITKLELNIPCNCYDKTEKCNYPTKEVLMFQSYVKELQEYNKVFFENVEHVDGTKYKKLFWISTNDLSKKCDLMTFSINITSLLSNIFVLVHSSQALCSILIKSHQNVRDSNFSGENLLSVIAVCARPVFYNQEVINKSMVHWTLRVFNTISNHCSQCCSNLFVSVINDIEMTDILNGSCSLETALLALKFLENCTGIRSLFKHQKETCVFNSIARLLEIFLTVSNSVKRNIEIVLICSSVLTSVIMLHGVLSVYNSECNCIAKIFDQIFRWVLNQQIFEENVLLRIFNLLQTLSKHLDLGKWFDLCSRIGSNYILMVDKLSHFKEFKIPALKDIVVEFAQQQNLSCIL